MIRFPNSLFILNFFPICYDYSIEHDKNGVTRVFERCHQVVAKGMDGRKFKRRLSEVNARAVPRGQNELVCKFKMAAGDMVSIRGQDVHSNRN